MTKVDIEAFKKEWFSFEEIQKVSESIKNFEKTWISHSHNEVKIKARNKIFSKQKTYV